MTKFEDYISSFPVKRFAKDTILLHQGSVPTNIYVVKSGYIKGFDISSEGNEQVVWLGGRRDMFPYAWLFSVADSSQLFYGAFSDAELYVIDKTELLEFLATQPETLLEVTRRMALTYNDLLAKLMATEKPKANDKIVHTLQILSDRFSIADDDSEGRKLAVPLTQQDIANLIGLTRETVAAELKKLKKGGYVHYDKVKFVVNQDRLSELL